MTAASGPGQKNIVQPARFNYSEANKSSGAIWDEKTFLTYIKDPRAAMPGNKMAFVGIQDVQDLADLMAYTRTLADTPAPLPQ